MTRPARNPHVLAYNAVRDAGDAEDAKRVYDTMEASGCHVVDACALDGSCPFYVDCMMAEGDGSD